MAQVGFGPAWPHNSIIAPFVGQVKSTQANPSCAIPWLPHYYIVLDKYGNLKT